MTTLVRALWLAADRASFSCNDLLLWKFFSTWRLFRAVSKRYLLEGETNKKCRKHNYLLNNWKKKKLAYRYFFSMSDEQNQSESEFYYPQEEEQRQKRPYNK